MLEESGTKASISTVKQVLYHHGVFCNDLSDHCAVVAVRNTKVPKTNPRFIRKRNLKCFNEQAFFH